MLFSIGATEDAASGRAARPGGTDPFRQTLLGSLRAVRPEHRVDEQADERKHEHRHGPQCLGPAGEISPLEDVEQRPDPEDEKERDDGENEEPHEPATSLLKLARSGVVAGAPAGTHAARGEPARRDRREWPSRHSRSERTRRLRRCPSRWRLYAAHRIRDIQPLRDPPHCFRHKPTSGPPSDEGCAGSFARGGESTSHGPG